MTRRRRRAWSTEEESGDKPHAATVRGRRLSSSSTSGANERKSPPPPPRHTHTHHPPTHTPRPAPPRKDHPPPHTRAPIAPVLRESESVRAFPACQVTDGTANAQSSVDSSVPNAIFPPRHFAPLPTMQSPPSPPPRSIDYGRCMGKPRAGSGRRQ